jgi:hypothetical protein
VSNVNRYAREGKLVTVSKPVGIYIHSLEYDKISAPEGHDVRKMWSIVRGSQDKKFCVRATFTVPEECLGELEESGRPIEFGSQIAQYIWVAVHLEVADKKTVSRNTAISETILTYIEGRHVKPIPMPPSQITSELQMEPFGQYLASTPLEKRARTLKELIAATLPNGTWVAFAADEGIGIKFKPPRDKVRVRLVIVGTPNSVATASDTQSKMADPDKLENKVFKEPTLTIVAVPPSDDPNNLNSDRSILQVASFAPSLGLFHFYDVSYSART